MKKKSIVIGFIVAIIIIPSIWLLTRPKALANISHVCSEPETDISTISFSANADEQIKISFASNIESGDLEIIIYDSAGNTIKELDYAKKLETFIVLGHPDTYILSAEYKEFIGNFKVNIYRAD